MIGKDGCCARTASGHMTAVAPARPMNLRRLIAFPEAQDTASYRAKIGHRKGHVRSGSKADMRGALAYVRFGPRADILFFHNFQTHLSALGDPANEYRPQ